MEAEIVVECERRALERVLGLLRPDEQLEALSDDAEPEGERRVVEDSKFEW